MIEVEAKVRLSPLKLSRVQRILKELKLPHKSDLKKDAYYGREKDFFIRIRESNGKAFLDLKEKRRHQGVEMNEEISLPLKSAAGFHRLLQQLGIKITAKKVKRNVTYSSGNFQFELNHIAGLGHFLEIETLVKTKAELSKAKKRLHQWFQKFGFKPRDFEKKYYLDLLQAQRKSVQ